MSFGSAVSTWRFRARLRTNNNTRLNYIRVKTHTVTHTHTHTITRLNNFYDNNLKDYVNSHMYNMDTIIQKSHYSQQHVDNGDTQAYIWTTKYILQHMYSFKFYYHSVLYSV